jgi:signal transduction histidine kinase
MQPPSGKPQRDTVTGEVPASRARWTVAISAAHAVHPTVRVNFLFRAITYPLFLVLYAVHVWGTPFPRWAIVLFLLHAFAYPYLARYVAERGTDSKMTERRNLLVDSLLIGCYVPVTGYAIWPNAVGLLAVTMGNVSNVGIRFAAVGWLLFAAGATIIGLLTGLPAHPSLTTPLTQAMSAVVVIGYTAAVGMIVNAQSSRVTRRNRQIREQHAKIDADAFLLAERSHQLEHALVAAEAANAAKSAFLANMSHELRTPLNSIIGFTNILQRGDLTRYTPQEQMYLARVRANGMHLLGLINGVLDLSKIEAGETGLELVPVDLAAVVRETLGELEPQAEARGVVLLAELPQAAMLTADPQRLKQIVVNLVGNAVKFTERGVVTVRVVTDEESGVPLRMNVVDTGIGIPPDRLETIFEAFQQADSTIARHHGGTGLGLTITRSLAALMGWTVVAKSAVGTGSTFSVLFAPAGDLGYPRG